MLFVLDMFNNVTRQPEKPENTKNNVCSLGPHWWILTISKPSVSPETNKWPSNMAGREKP